VKREEGNTNSPELSLLKFLLLTYHHSTAISWPPPWISHLFSQWRLHTFFNSWAVFGLDDLFLYQHVNKPTRYRQNQTSSTLDLVITNEEQMINETLYQPGLDLSDHVCLNFEYSHYVERYNRLVPKFNLYRADFSKLNNLISSVDWVAVMSDLDIISTWDYFSSVLDNYVKELFLCQYQRRRTFTLIEKLKL